MVAMRKSAGSDHAKKRRVGCENKFTNKGAWSKQEDQKLVDYIKKHGEGCWSTLPQSAGLLRCGKSCRLRWVNYLKPDVKRGNFGEDEEDLIIKLHALLGNRWSLIAGRLPGRTDNEVKNYWNSHLKKKLMRMGIDPNNHRLGERAAPADNKNNAVTCGSKTVSLSLPDLNLNYVSVEGPSSSSLVDDVDDDQQTQLLMTLGDQANINTHQPPHPFTTLLLFG